jgi:ABC-type tungstate transport system substrate-binding protein
VQAIMQQLADGSPGVSAIVAWTLIAAVLAMAGGALAGVRLAGKDLGNSLAAMMGAMFGPLASVPGVLIGLILLRLI